MRRSLGSAATLVQSVHPLRKNRLALNPSSENLKPRPQVQCGRGNHRAAIGYRLLPRSEERSVFNRERKVGHKVE